ncbi:hypothetical protein TWF102_010852 [Orbilia oligospora]|uniref:Uncharacterized protein n=1 Tax=Orbilia oligospora TaxID=2813651 RepID=A0A7C8NUG8_ORBOL|nr:hypothetical protein TWF102_010852 [Orbilia oligospora]
MERDGFNVCASKPHMICSMNLRRTIRKSFDRREVASHQGLKYLDSQPLLETVGYLGSYIGNYHAALSIHRLAPHTFMNTRHDTHLTNPEFSEHGSFSDRGIYIRMHYISNA